MTQRFTQNITISEGVYSQEVNGETVILNMKGESYFGLDEVGTRIWQLIKDNGDLQKTFETLLCEYDVEGDKLEKDLVSLVDDLKEKGLIEIVQPLVNP